MKKNDINVYVGVFAKEVKLDNDIYIPIQLGAANNKPMKYKKDNTGDNISEKNPSYCELTGMYWIWKNTNSKITGIVQYRRHFYKSMWNYNFDNIIGKEEIIESLKTNDCIVAKKSKIPFGTVEKYYSKHHYSKDYETLRNVIKEMYPEYLESFNKVSNSNYYYNLNMMICNKSIFDDYCKWLFDILFEVEKLSDTTNYSDYDKRVFGFLSEIMLRVWLEKNELKLKEYYVYNNEIPFFGQLIKRIIMNLIVSR